MTLPLPMFIDVGPDTLRALLACAKKVEGFPAREPRVQSAVAAVEQLVKDRQPADPGIVECVFRQGSVPGWKDAFRPGVAEVSVEAVGVLLAYAKSQIEHVGWCFDACDDDDLERKLPADSVESCPVCDSVYEIEKHVTQVRAWRSALAVGASGVTRHEKFDSEDDRAPGEAQG